MKSSNPILLALVSMVAAMLPVCSHARSSRPATMNGSKRR